jgi:hypothetical protein
MRLRSSVRDPQLGRMKPQRRRNRCGRSCPTPGAAEPGGHWRTAQRVHRLDARTVPLPRWLPGKRRPRRDKLS